MDRRGLSREMVFDICVKQCGARCCKSGKVFMNTEDMQRLKRLNPALRMSIAGKGGDGGTRWCMVAEPCIFLGADNRCTIYAERPFACRRYPLDGRWDHFCRLCEVI